MITGGDTIAGTVRPATAIILLILLAAIAIAGIIQLISILTQ
jgi:hypothetical protein